MSHIEKRKIQKNANWFDFEWFIDGNSFSEILKEKKSVDLPKGIAPFNDLCPAWTKKLNYYGDVRFVWNLLYSEERTPVPVYLCPDDLDFSCIVIVVEVEKTKDFVYWNKAGYVNIKDYSFDEEKHCGILCIENYSDSDWEKYGDNIALETADSEEWKNWIGKNWDEELYRRRINYTLKKYKNDDNILWFADLDFSFDRNEYEAMLNDYWNEETLSVLDKPNRNKIDFNGCVNLIKSLCRNGQRKLDEHIEYYGKVLLHVYAADEIGEPLFELLENAKEDIRINILSKAVEVMWRYGDDETRNVVEVTLLERLSDNENVWNRFGNYISEDFKNYIRRIEKKLKG